MGSIKRFASWLSGDRRKGNADPVRSTITSLKIFNRRLARQIKKMEQQGKLAKKKAIERRKAGDIPGSRLHMKYSKSSRIRENTISIRSGFWEHGGNVRGNNRTTGNIR